MAIQSNQRVKADIAKEKRKLNAIQRKMELQEKKEEFGEAWKRSLKEEQKKALEDVIGDIDTPKIKDSIDYNAFFDPINFYKDENGKVRDFDYQKYLDAEEAYQSGIEECDRKIANEASDEKASTKAKLQNQLAKEEKKKKSEPKIPNYLQKYYQNWVKYLHRYVPLYDKYVCTCCGKPKVQDDYFLVYAETDMGRIAPDGKMYSHICKDCCKKLYEYLYYEKANKDGEEAMKWLCSYLNIYFDDITYFKAKDAMEKNGKKNHIVEEYMNVVSRSATLKGKTFLESPNVGSVNSGSGGSSEKAEKIIKSTDGSVSDDIEENWSKADLEAKRMVVKTVGYDPFFQETETDRKILYKDLLGMLEQGMELDGLKVQAAIQIVLAFSRIRELNRKERVLMTENGSVSELKTIADLKNKQLDTITKFSRDNGFGERYAVAKAKGENSFTGIMAKMNEMKYEDATLNKYDIETSETIQQAADASFKAIFSQLGLSDADISVTCTQQLHEIRELRGQLMDSQENLRLAKKEIVKLKLERQKEEYDKEHEEELDWGGY